MFHAFLSSGWGATQICTEITEVIVGITELKYKVVPRLRRIWNQRSCWKKMKNTGEKTQITEVIYVITVLVDFEKNKEKQ